MSNELHVVHRGRREFNVCVYLTCALCGGREAHSRFTRGHTPAPTHIKGHKRVSDSGRASYD
jgi:hypothetical protein